MKKNFVGAFFLFICLGAAISAAAQNDSTVNVNSVSPAAEDKRGYLLGIGDEVEVKVLGEKDFDGLYTIDEDGKVQLPFVETPISALCRTDRELRGDITNLLRKYLREPQVNVRITEKRSRPPAVVYGEVRSPQQFDMRRSVSLLELLSYTGGTTEQASGAIQVFHTQPASCVDFSEKIESQIVSNDPLSVPSQVYRLSDLRDGKTEANPIVRPGDVIVVLRSAPVYIVGEVLAPRSLYIPENGLTLTDAVAMASGLTERAKKKDVRIYRLKPNTNQREMISANLDSIKKGQQSNPTLQPYDIVEVEKAPKSFGQTLKEIVTGAVQNTSNILPTRILY